ncbi:MAG: hormogonium polysaccharide biosynthesis protein HpsJ [Thainema sp.]
MSYMDSPSNAPMTGSAPSAPMTSIALKVVGVVTILASILDYIMIIFPTNFSNRGWQLEMISQIVDRGIVPMVGVALLLAGYWVQSISGRSGRRAAWADLRVWALVLSAIFGLVFLIFTVLHPNNVRVNSQQALEQIQEEATTAETQLEGRLSQELEQQRSQIDALIENEDLLAQAIESGQVPQEQAALLRQFREDPQALDQFLQERVGQFRGQIQQEIGGRREEAAQQIRQEALKSGIRVSVSSLILAIGYFIIAVVGFRNLKAGA